MTMLRIMDIHIIMTPDGRVGITAKGDLSVSEVLTALEIYKLRILTGAMKQDHPIAGLNARSLS